MKLVGTESDALSEEGVVSWIGYAVVVRDSRRCDRFGFITVTLSSDKTW